MIAFYRAHKLGAQSDRIHRITMALVGPDEFKYFLQHFGSKYPYKEVTKTRRKFHVKWIITNKPTTAAIPRNQGFHTAIPSSALDDDLVQYLIVYKKAQPVPAFMSNILDWMYCWGRAIDVNWYNSVVDWLHFLLHHGIHLSDRLVLRDCVEYRMRKVAHIRGLEVNSSINAWHNYFDGELDNGNVDYYSLAVKSIQFMNSIPNSMAGLTPGNVGSFS